VEVFEEVGVAKEPALLRKGRELEGQQQGPSLRKNQNRKSLRRYNCAIGKLQKTNVHRDRERSTQDLADGKAQAPVQIDHTPPRKSRGPELNEGKDRKARLKRGGAEAR